MKSLVKNISSTLTIAIALLIVVASAYLLLSPLSYFYITFKEPLSINESLDFLRDNGIDPRRHMVCIEGSTLQEYDDIYGICIGEINGKRQINSAVFNTKLYVFKALFDSRVEAWSIKGPQHPYD